MHRSLSIGLFVTLILLILSSAALPREHQPYILARLSLRAEDTAARLQTWHLDVVRGEKGRWLELVTNADQVSRLREAGYRVEVLIEDIEEHYAQKRKGDNFGDLYTYSEMIDELDAIHAAYPDITTARDSIGTTHEGRALWAIKVSDNPEVQENEPEVLLDALHHAREPITVSVVLNTLNHLCANYGTDPEITFLVDNRQIWFVPIVNPDGYIYNETNYPNGGGMWRKNRRNNGGGAYGVDPNRNYPYEWGGAGSSGDPFDETYRGPSAGSEPEIQAMMSFIESHQFVTQNSYHSVVGCILIPWGYTSSYCPDDSLYRALGDEMARDSGYPVGTAYDILAYLASGGTFDWSYGDTLAKPRIYAFSTEVGGSDWWPMDSEIPGLVQENLHSDLYLIKIAGAYPAYAGHTIADKKGPGQVDPGESVLMTVTLENGSPVSDAHGVSVVLSTDDAYVQLGDAQSAYGDIAAGASADNGADPFAFSVAAGCPQGHTIEFDLEISFSGGALILTESFQVLVGQPTYLYANDFESSSDWTEDPSHSASTGAFVRIDPNATTRQPGDDATPDPGIYAWITAQNSSDGVDDVDNGVAATRSPIIDLSGTSGAHLSMKYFHGQRDAGDDPGGDFFRIDVSNDGGGTYPVNLVSFGDETVAPTWRSLEVDLQDSLALTGQMRIRVQASDGTFAGDLVEGGVDDVFINTGIANTPPPAPALSLPSGGDTVGTSSPSLVAGNVIDPDGDPVTYGFRVYGDILLTDLVATVDGVAEGSGTTGWAVSPPLPSEGTYWWRAYAADLTERGPFSTSRSFHYTSSGPSPPADLWARTAGNGVALIWTTVTEAVGYVVYRDSVAGFDPGPEDSLGYSTDTVFVDEDAFGQGYYVIRAVDAGGGKSEDSARVGRFGKTLTKGE
jgi:hypothetical protein